jgi:hypothetical protein
VSGALGALLNVHGTRFQTDAVRGDAEWTRVQTAFNSGDRRSLSVNVLFGGYGQAKGEAWFDAVELRPASSAPSGEEKALPGDLLRGEAIALKHPAVSCVLCHTIRGQGSTVGPTLDGIATRFTPVYIRKACWSPTKCGLCLILKPQEIEDLKAYLQTLK